VSNDAKLGLLVGVIVVVTLAVVYREKGSSGSKTESSAVSLAKKPDAESRAAQTNRRAPLGPSIPAWENPGRNQIIGQERPP
jgi:hypothetical protein